MLNLIVLVAQGEYFRDELVEGEVASRLLHLRLDAVFVGVAAFFDVGSLNAHHREEQVFEEVD